MEEPPISAEDQPGQPGVPEPTQTPDDPDANVDSLGEPAPAEEMVPIEELSLEDLLNMETGVATKKATPLRESPSVITIVTRDEILSSGARDLVDILHLVPGLHVQYDVEGILGIGVRGLWAHEGKVLLLLDGHEMNERMYTSAVLGGRFGVENIQRVEVIRGPGSAIYGGYAELGVINIVTRGVDEFEGLSAGVYYGQMESARAARRGLTLTYNDRLGDVNTSIHFVAGESVRSDRTFTTFYDEEYQLGPVTAAADPLMANITFEWRGFKLRYLYDGYFTTNKSAYGDELSPEAQPIGFPGHYIDLSYELELLDGDLVITPRINVISVRPWRQTLALDEEEYPSAAYTFYDVTSTRTLWGATMAWDIFEGVNLLVGLEGFLDRAEVNDPGPFDQSYGDDLSRSREYLNFAFYSQVLWENEWVNVTGGVRMDVHERYGGAVAPRLGLTKVLGDFHAKALFAMGYRSPGIEQIEAGTDLRSETSYVFEAEAGYQPFPFLSLTANYFEMVLDDPIIYGYDVDNDIEYYENADITGSRGIEADIRLRLDFLTATASYSLYMAGDNSVEGYIVPTDRSVLVGFPTHKLTTNATLQLGRLLEPLDGLSLNTTLVIYTERSAYVAVDADDETVLGKEPTAALWGRVSPLPATVHQRPRVCLRGPQSSRHRLPLHSAVQRLPRPHTGTVPGVDREGRIHADVELSHARFRRRRPNAKPTSPNSSGSAPIIAAPNTNATSSSPSRWFSTTSQPTPRHTSPPQLANNPPRTSNTKPKSRPGVAGRCAGTGADRSSCAADSCAVGASTILSCCARSSRTRRTENHHDHTNTAGTNRRDEPNSIPGEPPASPTDSNGKS